MENKDIAEQFYFNGYLSGKILDDNEKLFKNFYNILENIYNSNIEDKNFYLKQIKNDQYDLFPNTWKLSQIFIDILLKSNLIDILNLAANQNLILTDIRTRLIKKSKKSFWGYIAPHRDSYYQKDKWMGPKLPSYKLIFYPDFENKNTEVMRIFPGSHRKMSKIKNGSLSDRFKAFYESYKKIFQTYNEFCFFIGTLRHWPLKENSEKGGLRIIYVFRDSRYLDDFKNNDLTKTFIDKIKDRNNKINKNTDLFEINKSEIYY